MSFLGLVGNMARIKYHDLADKKIKPNRTDAPLGLHQGSAVKIDTTSRLPVSSKGGLMPAFEGSQSITSVGRFELFGHIHFRSYLSDNNSFIQTVVDTADASKSIETKLFICLQENGGGDDVINWLLNDEDGAVGLGQFQLGQETPILYDRRWNPEGPWHIAPERFDEVVTPITGEAITIEHIAMAYARELGSERGQIVEHLMAEVVLVPGRTPTEEEQGSFNLFIGIELGKSDLEIFPSA
jgi:Protein of unknown function (DUF2491)